MPVERATLSDDEKTRLAQAAHENEERIQLAKAGIDNAHWALGELLLDSRDRKLWMVQNSTWGSFLASPEIGIEETTARRLVRLFIVRKALEAAGYQIDWSGISATRLTRDWLPCVRLDEKFRVVLNHKEVVELLEMARTLSLGDFKEMIRQKKIQEQKDIPEPVFKKDMLVLNSENQPIGMVSGARATESVNYVTIRIDNANARLPMKIEIRG